MLLLINLGDHNDYPNQEQKMDEKAKLIFKEARENNMCICCLSNQSQADYMGERVCIECLQYSPDIGSHIKMLQDNGC